MAKAVNTYARMQHLQFMAAPTFNKHKTENNTRHDASRWYLDTNESTGVVRSRQKVFDDGAQHPECIFLFHKQQQ